MSAATCCTSKLPPVVTSDYKPKGQYVQHAGLKTYVTGPATAEIGLLSIYDIFGFYPQTQQGADMLATALNMVVVMPDFFEGEPMGPNGFPADTDEKKAKLAEFFNTKAALGKNTAKVEEIVRYLKSKDSGFEGVKKWAVIGYCWGAKVATLVSGPGTPFSASIQCHPAMLDPANATTLTIPHLCLASKDEVAEAVEEFHKNIKAFAVEDVREKSAVETYTDMFHGWMGARARISTSPEDEIYLKGYEKGYKRVEMWLRSVLDIKS